MVGARAAPTPRREERKRGLDDLGMNILAVNTEKARGLKLVANTRLTHPVVELVNRLLAEYRSSSQ